MGGVHGPQAAADERETVDALEARAAPRAAARCSRSRCRRCSRAGDHRRVRIRCSRRWASDPAATLYAFFVEPLTTLYGWAELALKATPLAMIAAGLAAGFRANVWNIGAEGQFTAGAIAAAAWRSRCRTRQGMWVLPLMLPRRLRGRHGLGAIPAFLRARFGANEILVSLMLVYVADAAAGRCWCTGRGAIRRASTSRNPRMFSDAAMLPIDPARHAADARAADRVPRRRSACGSCCPRIACSGFRIRTVGAAPAAARYAGFARTAASSGSVLLIGGGLAGLAGHSRSPARSASCTPAMSPGYGFTAIIVAFLGRLHPVGIIPAALLMALFYLGGEAAQISVALPTASTGVSRACCCSSCSPPTS